MLADRGVLVEGERVKGERVKAVGDTDEILRQAPKDAAVIDLSKATVLPGLIDCHTHVLLQGDVTQADYDEQLLKESIPYRTIRATVAARTALMNGRRQYSHRPSARRRINRSSVASMPGVSAVFLEGAAGLGLHQVDERAHAKPAFQFFPFDGCERIALVLYHQVMEPVQILAVEFQPQERSRRLVSQIMLIGTDKTGKYRRFRAARDTLFGSHNFYLRNRLSYTTSHCTRARKVCQLRGSMTFSQRLRRFRYLHRRPDGYRLERSQICRVGIAPPVPMGAFSSLLSLTYAPAQSLSRWSHASSVGGVGLADS